jgi:predicted double-glycine peptidase
MEVIIAFAILITFMGTVYPTKELPKNHMEIYTGMAGAEHIALNYQVKPFVDFKDKHIIKQAYDYSCGSASLATLLNGYLGEKLTEQQVIQGMMQYGDAAKIQERRAFSLLDMKRFVEVLGYKGNGYKAEFDDLKTLDKPAIMPMEFFGYKHFVVFRGIHGDHVFVADPNLGNVSYAVEKFKEIWTPSIVFVVSDEDVKTNALRLRNEDLRLVEYSMLKSSYPQVVPEQSVRQQWDMKESTGWIIRTKKQ